MTGGEEWSGPVVRTIVKNPPTPGKLRCVHNYGSGSPVLAH
jgi:hypothetical protein